MIQFKMTQLTLAALHGGFFVVDGQKLGLALLLSCLLGAGTILAVRRIQGRKQVASWTALASLAYFMVILLFFHWILDYPIFRLVSFFKLP